MLARAGEPEAYPQKGIAARTLDGRPSSAAHGETLPRLGDRTTASHREAAGTSGAGVSRPLVLLAW